MEITKNKNPYGLGYWFSKDVEVHIYPRVCFSFWNSQTFGKGLETFGSRIFFLRFLKFLGWYGFSYEFLAALNAFHQCLFNVMTNLIFYKSLETFAKIISSNTVGICLKGQWFKILFLSEKWGRHAAANFVKRRDNFRAHLNMNEALNTFFLKRQWVKLLSSSKSKDGSDISYSCPSIHGDKGLKYDLL
jgi:hypothetical protein